MQAMIDFFKTLFLMPLHWRIWVALLMVLNMVAPLFFITTLEAQMVLLAMMLNAATMIAIFAQKGFVRLLGLGHIYWLPLVGWLATRPVSAMDEGPMLSWLLSLMVVNSISLVIDTIDVIRYFLGEKAPTLELPARTAVMAARKAD